MIGRASALDPLIAVYVAAAMFFAAVLIVWEVVSYLFWQWRAKRRARNVIDFRRPRQSAWSLVRLNVRDRIDEWRERYATWRHGDRTVGDALIDRMEKLR